MNSTRKFDLHLFTTICVEFQQVTGIFLSIYKKIEFLRNVWGISIEQCDVKTLSASNNK